MIKNFTDFRNKALSSKLKKMEGDRLYNIERSISVRISWLLVRIFPSIKASYISLVSLVILFCVFASNLLHQEIFGKETFFIIQLCALYLIVVTDKVDGEIARVTENLTQKGVYYDRAVHFVYPIIFYFTIGHYFYILSGQINIFFITIILGVLTQQLIFFNEARLLIGTKIKKGEDFKDLRVLLHIKKTRPNILFRLVDYMTFMIYAWVLFFYVLLGIFSIWIPNTVYVIYIIQVITAIIIVSYKVFISYPHHKLYSKDEADKAF